MDLSASLGLKENQQRSMLWEIKWLNESKQFTTYSTCPAISDSDLLAQLHLTSRFHVAMCLFTNWSQMMSQNVVRTKTFIASCVTDVHTRFWHSSVIYYRNHWTVLYIHPRKTWLIAFEFRLAHVTIWRVPICECHSWYERGRGKIKKQTAAWDECVRRAFHPLEMIYGHGWLSGGRDFSTEFFSRCFRDTYKIKVQNEWSNSFTHMEDVCPAFDVPQRLIRTNEKICQMFSFTFICNITVLEIVLITKWKY